MKRILSLALAASLSVGVMTGCGKGAAAETNPDKEGSYTVMTINGQEVSSEEYAGFLCYEKQIYENYYSSYLGSDTSALWGDDTMISQVQDAAYNELVYGYAISALAEELGVTLDDADKKEIADIKQQYYDGLQSEATSTSEAKDGETAYQEYINSLGFSTEMFEGLLENSVLLENIQDYYYGDEGTEKIAEDAITDYYNQNYYHVKHILISNTDADGNERADGGLSIAKEVVSKLQAGGDFEALMQEYNTDTGEPETGYTFSENDSFVAEFIEGSKALEVGAYTVEPVKSTYGYHVIMRLPLEADTLNADAGSVNGAKIYDEIKESMEDMDSKIDEAINKLKIEKTDDFDKVTLLTYDKFTAVDTEPLKIPATDSSEDAASSEADASGDTASQEGTDTADGAAQDTTAETEETPAE